MTGDYVKLHDDGHEMLATPPDNGKLNYHYKIPFDKDGVWCANMDVFFPNIGSIVMFSNSKYND
tara:strand:- start:692 stop:883 length:192 start_codon:yes stop_codon:yes gene_type:complete